VILPCASFFPALPRRRSPLPESKVHRRIFTKLTLPCASLGRAAFRPERLRRMRRLIAGDVARSEHQIGAKLLATPCRVIFGLTHSKQRIGARINRNTFRGLEKLVVRLTLASCRTYLTNDTAEWYQFASYSRSSLPAEGYLGRRKLARRAWNGFRGYQIGKNKHGEMR
jgi:hypothetical protein